MSTGVPQLDPVEARILGCLIEKQHTTPAGYPLTLNALRTACNQSTNRDPVVDYDDELIFDTIQKLHRKELTRSASGHGSRSAKYRHLAAERLSIDDAGEAILAVLLLRGAQTPGELKTRTERLHAFGELGEIERTLDALIDAGYVERLERRPGEKQVRYRELFTSDGDSDDSSTAPVVGLSGLPSAAPAISAQPAVAEGDLAQRVAALEAEVAELRALLEAREQG
jgi:uncharacterized protein YceH (UPF0502 family)